MTFRQIPVRPPPQRQPQAAIRLPAIILVGGLIVAAACGCSGGRKGVDLVRVSGTLTCDRGPMPAAGQILFVPRAVVAGSSGSRPLRPGSAAYATDGTFAATSWTPGDGLVPGTYAVVVDCWKVPPTMDGPPAESFIDPAYETAEMTPLEVVVPADSGPLTLMLDVHRRP